jgi:hypothetical protein
MTRQAIWSSDSNADAALVPWLVAHWRKLDIASKVAFYLELRGHAQLAGIEEVNGGHVERLVVIGPRLETREASLQAILQFMHESPFLRPIRQHVAALRSAGEVR